MRELRASGLRVATGEFQAMMQVGARQRRAGDHPARQQEDVLMNASVIAFEAIAQWSSCWPRSLAASPAFAQQRPLRPKIPNRSAPAGCCSKPVSTTSSDVNFRCPACAATCSRCRLRRQHRRQLDRRIQIDGGLYQKLSITEQVAARRCRTLLDFIDDDTTDDVDDILIGDQGPMLGETAQPARDRHLVHDAAAERR